MKILSIFSYDQSAPPQPPSEDMQGRMMELINEFRSKGHLIDTGGAMDGMLELKVSRNNGKTTVTDGPFTESKEIVGGYALWKSKIVMRQSR